MKIWTQPPNVNLTKYAVQNKLKTVVRISTFSIDKYTEEGRTGTRIHYLSDLLLYTCVY